MKCSTKSKLICIASNLLEKKKEFVMSHRKIHFIVPDCFTQQCNTEHQKSAEHLYKIERLHCLEFIGDGVWENKFYCSGLLI